jgi:hypothetical protein
VAFGLLEMELETFGQLTIGRLLDHVGKRLLDLFLGVVDILQRVDEQVVEILDVLRKETHWILLRGLFVKRSAGGANTCVNASLCGERPAGAAVREKET